MKVSNAHTIPTMYREYHGNLGILIPMLTFSPCFHLVLNIMVLVKVGNLQASETKCPIFVTGYDESDIKNDVKAFEQYYQGEFDWVWKPTVNEFGIKSMT